MRMTFDELEQRLATILVEVFYRRIERGEGETDLAVASRLTHIPIGHIRRFLRDREVVVSCDDIHWTQDQLDELEAHVVLPLEESAPIASQQFNVTAGDGSQVQVGHQVSGNQSIVTYQQVLEELKDQIERSSMPEERKKSALQKLADFLGSPGVGGLAQLGTKLLGMSSKDG